MSYKHARILVIAILLIYFAAGVSLRVFKSISPNQEIYPFFSWKIFSDVPQPNEQIFKVRITMVDGKYLSDPYFYLSRRLKNRDTDRPTWEESLIVQNLGKALVNNDEAQISEFKQSLEDPFGTSSVVYEVVQFKAGEGEQIIGTFTHNDTIEQYE